MIQINFYHFLLFSIEKPRKRRYPTEGSDSYNQPEGKSAMSNKPVLPSKEQTEWLRSEVGVIIHLDLQVFENTYNFRDQWGYTPSPQIFQPTELDTDQWISTAAEAGAKYAILVAKHCSGFSLWPTRAHSYSVASSPWRDGKGDIVADFIASCRKYGVKPGIYCSASANAYLHVDNPGIVVGGTPEDNRKYNEIVIQQLTELWSNYGPLFELWFDGGVLPVEKGGPPVAELKKKLQPDAIVFEGPRGCPNRIRHSGAEDGSAVLPAWGAVDSAHLTREGNPDGDEYMPIECDLANRNSVRAFQGGWFWHEGQDDAVHPVSKLVDCYYKSVGRNSNFLIGMVIDNRGLVPEVDRGVFRGFGNVIRRIQELPRDTVSGRGTLFELKITQNKEVSEVLLREDFAQGERIRKYRIDAFDGQSWETVLESEGIGHKRLLNFPRRRAEKLRLVILSSEGTPLLEEFSAYLRSPIVEAPGIVRDKEGLITITVPEESEVRYTLDGSLPTEESMLYTGPFRVEGPGFLRAVTIPLSGFDPAFPELRTNPIAELHFGVVDTDWEVLSADSEYDEQNRKENILLNNQYPWISGKTAELPHEFLVDMKRDYEVRGFIYTPAWTPGHILKYEFYVGDSPDNVNTLAGRGSFGDILNMPVQQVVRFEKSFRARYYRFRATANASGRRYASVFRMEIITD